MRKPRRIPQKRDTVSLVLWLAVAVAAAFFVAALFSGCSMIAGSRTKAESLQTTDRIVARQEATLKRATEGLSQPVQLEVRGRENKVEVNLPAPTVPPHEEMELSTNGGQDAGSSVAAFAKSSWAIPLGVSIILIAIGGFLILALVKRIKSSSAAARAAFELADQRLASEIEKHGEEMAIATDNDTIKRHAVAMAGKERDRRRLRDKPRYNQN